MKRASWIKNFTWILLVIMLIPTGAMMGWAEEEISAQEGEPIPPVEYVEPAQDAAEPAEEVREPEPEQEAEPAQQEQEAPAAQAVVDIGESVPQEQEAVELPATEPRDTYLVEYYAYDELVWTQTYAHGERIEAPTLDAICDGYVFVHWYDDLAYPERAFTFGAPVTRPMTLHALFIDTAAILDIDDALGAEGPVHVPIEVIELEEAKEEMTDWAINPPSPEYPELDADGVQIITHAVTYIIGEKTWTQTYIEGRTAEKPNVDPVHTGYRFAHWYDAEDEQMLPYDFATPLYASVTLHALFEALSAEELEQLALEEERKAQEQEALAAEEIPVPVDVEPGVRIKSNVGEQIQFGDMIVLTACVDGLAEGTYSVLWRYLDAAGPHDVTTGNYTAYGYVLSERNVTWTWVVEVIPYAEGMSPMQAYFSIAMDDLGVPGLSVIAPLSGSFDVETGQVVIHYYETVDFSAVPREEIVRDVPPEGVEITFPQGPAREDQTFVGWRDRFTGQAYQGTMLVKPCVLTLVPEYQAVEETGTVTIHYFEEGDFSRQPYNEVFSNVPAEGRDITFIEGLQREGYTFVGWKDRFTGERYSGTMTLTPGVLTLIPEYEAIQMLTNPLAIYYFGEEGLGAPVSEEVYANVPAQGVEVTLAQGPQKEGYAFVGWRDQFTGRTFSGTMVLTAGTLALTPVYEEREQPAGPVLIYYYDAADADAPAMEDVYEDVPEAGMDITLRPGPQREDAVFVGWRDRLTGQRYQGEMTITPCVLALVPEYEAPGAENGPVLIYYYDEEGSAPLKEEIILDVPPEGKEVDLMDGPEKEGRLFAGWQEAETGETYDAVALLQPRVLKLSATYEQELTYTIRYLVDGEPYDEEQTGLAAGETVTLLAGPEKEGHTFLGWLAKDAEEDAAPLAGESEFTMPESDVELTAVYEEIPALYTLTYEVADGLSQVEEHEAGATVTLKAEAQREGHAFTGWEDSVSGELYSAGSTYEMPACDVVMKAVFAPLYTLTYRVEGVPDGVPEARQLAGGQEETLAKAPVRTGYTFVGWRDVTGQTYQEGAPYVMPDADVTLTAVYEQADSGIFTLTYYVDGNVYRAEQNLQEGKSVQILAGAPKQGHMFEYWMDQTSMKTYAPGAQFEMPAQNVSLTAIYTKKTYTLTVYHYLENSMTPVFPAHTSRHVYGEAYYEQAHYGNEYKPLTDYVTGQILEDTWRVIYYTPAKSTGGGAAGGSGGAGQTGGASDGSAATYPVGGTEYSTPSSAESSNELDTLIAEYEVPLAAMAARNMGDGVE